MSYTKSELEKKSESFLQIYMTAKDATITMHPDRQFDDWDMKVSYPDGVTNFVEIKSFPHPWNDLLVEIIEDIDRGDPGWWYQTKADTLAYVFYNNEIDEVPESIYTITTTKVKSYIAENAEELFRLSKISRKGYGITLFIYLPLDLATKIYPETKDDALTIPW